MESSSEDPRKSRTILRSVIDAFRGTPTVTTSVGVEIEEVGLEDEFDPASLNARNSILLRVTCIAMSYVMHVKRTNLRSRRSSAPPSRNLKLGKTNTNPDSQRTPEERVNVMSMR